MTFQADDPSETRSLGRVSGLGGDTTLAGIDTTNNRISIQSPANAGSLAPTGNLGVDAGPSAGFDIYYSPESDRNRGFVALETSGSYHFYQINLLNGSAEDMGEFPDNRQVVDVALPLDQD